MKEGHARPYMTKHAFAQEAIKRFLKEFNGIAEQYNHILQNFGYIWWNSTEQPQLHVMTKPH